MRAMGRRRSAPISGAEWLALLMRLHGNSPAGLHRRAAVSANVVRKARLLFAAVLCAGGLAAGLWYIWSSAQYMTYQIETHDSVSGLIADSPVELHGVEVGKVTKIELTDPR